MHVCLHLNPSHPLLSTMLYKSTRGSVEDRKFEETLFSGFTEDGGLFIPSKIPIISKQQLVSWKGQSYRKIVNNLVELYIEDSEIPRNDLECIVENSFKNFSAPDVVPIKELYPADGTSDDFDQLIQHIFVDWDFAKEHNLCSINSINWARILVQVAHYVYIYLKLCVHVEEMVEFIVPTGGCGHITAGMLAQKMGLPIRITATVNTNDFVHQAVTAGNLSIQQTVHKTLASSMDIQVPLNFERILYMVSDGDCSKVKAWMEELGKNLFIQLPKKVTEKLQKVLKSFRADNATIVSAIKRCWTENNYYVCPHTATSLAYIYHNFKEISSKR
ncbi:threonine synthase-like 2 isoform X2 [Limulus polyphemus]|uniref:Threonine synthase-like 2 isoform X2 n=1 Tax=Limulus polyphemus TaxID=6850 RepID=A0ABM1RZQ3_LIMPO|nr:threonine synthase-like 2 isoform X2 [Limulus polyphemus]